MSLQSLRVVIVAIASFIMATLRTVIVTVRMEKNAMENETYYLPDTPDTYVFAVISIILMLLFGVFAFTLGKKKSVDVDDSYGSVPTGALILAFSLIFAAFFFTMNIFTSDTVSSSVVEIIAFVFTLLSMVKFIYNGLLYKFKLSLAFQSFLAMMPIFLTVFRLLGDFISKSAAPFASSGGYHIIGLVAVMLFFLLEGRSYVSPTMAFLYCFFGYTAVFFLVVYAVPDLILHCFGTFRFDYHTAYSVVDIATATYIATRLSSAKFRKMVSR